MTKWWVIVNIPGWMASYLTHLPEASSVVSYRKMTRYTENTIGIVENITGTNQSYCVRIVTDEECTIETRDKKHLPCSIRHIEKGAIRTTHGSVTSLNTTYWHINSPDGTFQVHKTIDDESGDSVQWTAEMWGDVPDADILIKVIRKYISS